MTEDVTLSIVVTSFSLDRLADIGQLLQSIREQAYPALETVFVADNSPELAERVEEQAAKLSLPVKVLVTEGAMGVGVCRNRGILASQGDIVAMVDDDTVLLPGWAEAMIDTYRMDSQVVGVTGPAIPHWENDDMSWFPQEFYWMWGGTVWDWDQVREIRNVGGMNCSFKRQALFQAGLYQSRLGPKGGDEKSSWLRLGTGEEVELSLRIRRCLSGAKIVYNPKVRVHHKVYASRFRWRFMAKRAFLFGYAKRYVETLFAEDYQEEAVLHLERDHLRHIFLEMLPSLAIQAPRAPRTAARKAAVALIGTTFAGLGYMAYRIKPAQSRKQGR